MKIAARHFSLLASSALVLALGMTGLPEAASAADTTTAPATAATPAPAALAPLPTPTAPSASIALPPPPSGGTGSRSRNLTALEEKVTDAIKNSVKQLSSSDNINLDDMNTARQAIAKLEILIDIEKRFAELDKIRNDRSGEKTLAAAIPASALTAPQTLLTPRRVAIAPDSSSSVAANAGSGSRSEITKITGAAGKYVATIQGKSYRVGDLMPDGSTITAITAKQVSSKGKNGVIRQSKVKGVEAVYSDTF